MTCNAPTSMHDGVDVRGYYHVAPRQYTVMCRGCATCLENMGADWKADRRAADAHVWTDRRRTSRETEVEGNPSASPSVSPDARRASEGGVPALGFGRPINGRPRHPA